MRGRNLGLKLIAALQLLAKEVGCYKVILDCSKVMRRRKNRGPQFETLTKPRALRRTTPASTSGAASRSRRFRWSFTILKTKGADQSFEQATAAFAPARPASGRLSAGNQSPGRRRPASGRKPVTDRKPEAGRKRHRHSPVVTTGATHVPAPARAVRDRFAPLRRRGGPGRRQPRSGGGGGGGGGWEALQPLRLAPRPSPIGYVLGSLCVCGSGAWPGWRGAGRPGPALHGPAPEGRKGLSKTSRISGLRVGPVPLRREGPEHC